MKHIYEQKIRAIFALCIALIIVSLNLFMAKEVSGAEINNFEYKDINIRDMSAAKVAVKAGSVDEEVVSEIEKATNLNLTNRSNISQGKVQAVSLPAIEKKEEVKEPVVQRATWRLPVENGIVTTWPNYNHVAFDITSWRGTAETIYPVADGEISGIYSDYAGALIVMVHHYIDGVHYTSQYVHLSSYAPGIYVGMPVTTDTPLGQMGSTGISTGNHLHISVVDCNYGSAGDSCGDLNGFFNYLKVRYQQGFQGLNSIINVPWAWTSR